MHFYEKILEKSLLCCDLTCGALRFRGIVEQSLKITAQCHHKVYFIDLKIYGVFT